MGKEDDRRKKLELLQKNIEEHEKREKMRRM